MNDDALVHAANSIDCYYPQNCFSWHLDRCQILCSLVFFSFFLPRDALVQSAVLLRLHVVRPSVCPSVTFVYQGHVGWNSWKLITRIISPTPSVVDFWGLYDILLITLPPYHLLPSITSHLSAVNHFWQLPNSCYHQRLQSIITPATAHLPTISCRDD